MTRLTVDEMQYGDVFVDSGGGVNIKVEVATSPNTSKTYILWVASDKYCKIYLDNKIPIRTRDYNEKKCEVVFSLHDLTRMIQELNGKG